MQASANIAAYVMLGRALEAMCQHILEGPKETAVLEEPKEEATPKKYMTLSRGIDLLRAKKIIDDRLYDWSQQLRAFRNVAAHAQDVTISRQDAEDLQTFLYAIVEYVYDLADRYDEFKVRTAKQGKSR